MYAPALNKENHLYHAFFVDMMIMIRVFVMKTYNKNVYVAFIIEMKVMFVLV